MMIPNNLIVEGGRFVFCSKCGTKMDDNAKFCGGCGSLVGNTVSTATAKPPVSQHVTPTPAPVPVPPKPVYQQPVPPAYQAQPVVPLQPVYQQPVQPNYQAQPVVPPQSVYQQPVQPAYQAQPSVPPQPAQSTYQQPVQPAQSTYQQPASQQRPLDFNVFGGNLPAVSIKLSPGESIYTQSGGMIWMDDGITMTTNMQGGLMKGLGRMFSGDSLFMATYTSSMPNQEIAIASTFPGSIAAIELKGNSIIAQKSAFLCAQQSVTLSVFVTRSLGAGLFGGEGFILQKLTGYGRVFLEIDGSMVERTLAPGQRLKVDTGNVAAFEETVNYQSEMVKGFKNILFGGEGLFLTTLTGPGKVWLQTMTMPTFAKQLIPFLPKPSSN